MCNITFLFLKMRLFFYRSESTNNTKVLILILLLTSGCSSIPTEPFKAFSNSLVELSIGTDKALAELIPLSEKNFKRDLIKELDSGRVSSGQDSLLESLAISTDLSTITVKVAPLFLKTEQFKIGTGHVTKSLVMYSQLLIQLSDPELLSKKTFNDLAIDLNANAFQAVSTMNTDPSERTLKKIALFSQLAIATTQSYLQSKRKSELVNALEKNQQTVDEYAKAMQRAVKIMTKSINVEYLMNYRLLIRNASIKNTRIQGVDDLIALDRNYIRQIKTLQALYQAYGDIPSAHAELAKVVSVPEKGLSKIIHIMEAGKQLQAGYDSSLAFNKSENAQAKADMASAQADALEAQAETAVLRFANANVLAVNARIEANAEPNNNDKEVAAQQLEKNAKDLKAEAEKKKTSAQELRAAANAVQQSVDEIKKRLITVP